MGCRHSGQRINHRAACSIPCGSCLPVAVCMQKRGMVHRERRRMRVLYVCAWTHTSYGSQGVGDGSSCCQGVWLTISEAPVRSHEMKGVVVASQASRSNCSGTMLHAPNWWSLGVTEQDNSLHHNVGSRNAWKAGKGPT